MAFSQPDLKSRLEVWAGGHESSRVRSGSLGMSQHLHRRFIHAGHKLAIPHLIHYRCVLPALSMLCWVRTAGLRAHHRNPLVTEPQPHTVLHGREVSRPSPSRCGLGRHKLQLAPPAADPILLWLCLGKRWEPAFAWPPSPQAVAPWEAWSASSGVSHSRFLCLLPRSQGRSLPRGHRQLWPRLQGQWTGGVAVWRQVSPARPDAISQSLERRGHPGVYPEAPSHDPCAHPTLRATMPDRVSSPCPLSTLFAL